MGHSEQKPFSLPIEVVIVIGINVVVVTFGYCAIRFFIG
ncbi:hypothetical protein V1281_006782 [Nitrobacteraceae bacterium AZCC 2161]